MSGAGLIAIKRRIKSITNTRKITKAMGLVATSKLKRLRYRLLVNEQYYSKYNDIIKLLFESYEEHSIYTYGNGNSKKLYIVLTSDTGLCGGFNLNVLNKALDKIGADRDNALIMIVGQKGRNYFNKLRYETVAEYIEVPHLPNIKESREIASRALEMFINKEVGEVSIVFTRFLSAVKQEVQVNRLLPVEFKSKTSINDKIIFEPELDDMIEDAVKLYMNEVVLYSMLNAKASENSARMNAMDGATKNANDLLQKLNLRYNRIRQSAITQEISEIVGGAEAQR
jgi:F-type H+-transporting ATPase subunit gamma